MERLTQKVGPLPVWAYGVILGGAVGIYVFWIRGRGTSDGEEEVTEEDSPAGNATPGQLEFSPDGIVSSSPYAGGALPGQAGGALDVNELYSINPDTGRPYIVDLNDPINPVTGLPFDADYAAALAREEDLQRILGEYGAELQRYRDRLETAPEPTPLPTISEPAPPAPAPASAPSKPPTTGPVGGRQVGPWATKAMRDKAVAGIPANKVRKFSKGGKFYAEIFD